METIKQAIIEGLQEFFIGIFKNSLSFLVAKSYIVCLLIVMVSALLFIAGVKKSVKVIKVTTIIYVVLQALGSLV